MERDNLLRKYGNPAYTNGLIVQLCIDGKNLPAATPALWLLQMAGHYPCQDTLTNSLRSRMRRVCTKASKLRGQILENFKNEPFDLPFLNPTVPVTETLSTENLPPLSPPSHLEHSEPATLELPPQPSTSQAGISRRDTPKKKLNTTRSLIAKNERKIGTQERQLAVLKNEIVRLTEMKNHYGVRNVNKREIRLMKKKSALTQEKKNLKSLLKMKDEQVCRLKADLKKSNLKNLLLQKKFQRQKHKVRKFTAVTDKNILQTDAERVRGAEREAEEVDPEAEEEVDPEAEEEVDPESETGEQAEGLEDEERAPGREERIVETKRKDNAKEFTDAMRFCIMELTGLEVATNKISPVIECVGKLCGVKFTHLPSRMGCQKIVDEGQVVAKNYLRERILKRCKSFGIHKDGTTRKKVKILDTSIQTDEGDVFSLGWSSVVSETGVAIADEAEEKLKEVVHSTTEEGEEMMKECLQKLDYLMNDRAANEKLSSRLIEDWREQSLKAFGVKDIKKMDHLFCAAHVLLGFHSYVLKAIKSMKVYKTDSKEYKHPILTMLKDASDVFGPAGNHKGARDKWQAYCKKKSIKSTIQNYKDNRFNGLFEVSAQLFHHHQDCLELLVAAKITYAKCKRLEASLKTEKLITLIECLAIFFHKITGPFWKMVISSKVSHHEFNIVVRKIVASLKKSKKNPSFILQPNSFGMLSKYTPSSSETCASLPESVREDMKELVSVISGALLTTLEVQVIPNLPQTSRSQQGPVAPLTNLVCERHFGYLDSSQRRRPHSSLHHHSSVILMKQTRGKLREWYDGLSLEEKKRMWTNAKRKGQAMRKKHQEKDKRAVMDSIRNLKFGPEPAGETEPTAAAEPAAETAPFAGTVLSKGQMIAVACEDTWYPAVVETESVAGDDDVVVSFAVLGKGLGNFRWPTGKDVHSISRKSVIEEKVDVVIRANGRSWMVVNAKEIQEKFKHLA